MLEHMTKLSLSLSASLSLSLCLCMWVHTKENLVIRSVLLKLALTPLLHFHISTVPQLWHHRQMLWTQMEVQISLRFSDLGLWLKGQFSHFHLNSSLRNSYALTPLPLFSSTMFFQIYFSPPSVPPPPNWSEFPPNPPSLPKSLFNLSFHSFASIFVRPYVFPFFSFQLQCFRFLSPPSQPPLTNHFCLCYILATTFQLPSLCPPPLCHRSPSVPLTVSSPQLWQAGTKALPFCNTAYLKSWHRHFSTRKALSSAGLNNMSHL